jgi:hypothetical protein
MPTLVAQIAPQKSTQYATLASTLAPHELKLSPVGEQITEICPHRLGGQDYVKFDLPVELDEEQTGELAMLAMTSTFFVYYEKLGQVAGPLLHPIETHYKPALPPELVTTRRYRGKTNELFTHFMCNIARFSSALAHRPWSTLRVFDPLAGGGTTLFMALVLGASAAGVEHKAKDAESTAAFLRQYAREQGIACKEKKERLRETGRRWLFTIGKETRQQCIVACGDTGDSATLISGFRPHLIIADLPYGIQHRGELVSLLTRALPVWASLLPPSGAMALAWESSRFRRSDLVALVESVSPLSVLNDPPYNALAHRVDRVIKQRDVLVVRPKELFYQSER